MMGHREFSQKRGAFAAEAPGAEGAPNATSTVDDAAASHVRERPPGFWLVPTLSAGAALLLAAAWLWRPQHYLSPDRGVGYALGIVGFGAMLLLLLYPLRKHGWLPARAGPLPVWFHIHMALGILGPACVLLHSNFRFGSTNSTVALSSAMIVASSGYFGRFVYSRIHIDLSGHRTRFAELCRTTRDLRDAIGPDAQPITPDFERFEAWATEPDTGVLSAFARFARSRSRIRALRERAAGVTSAHSGFDARLCDYLRAAEHVARFRAYERMFGLWHGLHLPLTAFLYGASLVHVIAVHAY